MKILLLAALLLAAPFSAPHREAGREPPAPGVQLARAEDAAEIDPAGDSAAAIAEMEERRERDHRIARSRFRYLMLGYGLVWLSLGAYLVSLHRRIGGVRREIAGLEARLEDLRER